MSTRVTIALMALIAAGILVLSWVNYQAGVANGICRAHGYERHQEWTSALDRPVRCTFTVYGTAAERIGE